jgi:hypothetical protein
MDMQIFVTVPLSFSVNNSNVASRISKADSTLEVESAAAALFSSAFGQLCLLDVDERALFPSCHVVRTTSQAVQ